MNWNEHPGLTPASRALTDVMLEVFRLNGRLLAAGDAMVAPAGLSAARWQVLGAIATLPHASTMAGIARAMGLSRQAVRRVVNDLHEAGMVRFADNPDHRRAMLVRMTPSGEAVLATAIDLHVPWATELSRDLDPRALEAAAATLRRLGERLEGGRSASSRDTTEEDTR